MVSNTYLMLQTVTSSQPLHATKFDKDQSLTVLIFKLSALKSSEALHVISLMWLYVIKPEFLPCTSFVGIVTRCLLLYSISIHERIWNISMALIWPVSSWWTVAEFSSWILMLARARSAGQLWTVSLKLIYSLLKWKTSFDNIGLIASLSVNSETGKFSHL